MDYTEVTKVGYDEEINLFGAEFSKEDLQAAKENAALDLLDPLKRQRLLKLRRKVELTKKEAAELAAIREEIEKMEPGFVLQEVGNIPMSTLVGDRLVTKHYLAFRCVSKPR